MKKLSFFLIVILFIAACNNTAGTDEANTDNTEQTEAVIEVATLQVTGMHCGSCENSITTTLEAMDGVITAKASVDKGMARVKFDPAKVSPEDFKAAIEDKGYEVTEYEIMDPKDKPAKPVE